MPSFSKDNIPQDWQTLLGDYFDSTAWRTLESNLQQILLSEPDNIGPQPQHFFKALTLTPVDAVKVVIIGQDPYHSPGLAQGLAFSIPANIPVNTRAFPSSLRNISKALSIEGFGALPNGDLQHWSKQGVLLLNTALSVRLGEAGSHTHIGWKELVDRLITELAIKKPFLAWMLWGGHAQSKLPMIEAGREQFILQSSHPSGLGVYKTDKPFLLPDGFGSCNHFTKTNHWLEQHGHTPIRWVLDHVTASEQPQQTSLFD